MLTAILSFGTKLLWALSAIAAWFRIRAAKDQGRQEQALDSLTKAERDEAIANRAGRDAGRVPDTAPDRFTRTE